MNMSLRNIYRYWLKTVFCLACFFYIPQAKAWTMTVNAVQTYEKFVYDENAELYTGEMEHIYLEHRPPEGKIYVLADLVATPVQEKAPLTPADFRLRIEDKIYPRQMDDYFLLDYRMRPFTHMDVTVGTQKGKILFEIPIEQRDLPKTFFYKQQPIPQKK